MKILVTGGCGFIGSNLVRLLVETKGCDVVNVDKLTYAGNPSLLADLAGHARYQFEQVDLCDGDALNAVFARHQPDAVMHLAAESHVDRSIDGPGEFIQTNICGTYQLLQASLAYWQGLPDADECKGEKAGKSEGHPTKNLPPSHLPTQVSGLKSQPSSLSPQKKPFASSTFRPMRSTAR